MAEVHTIQWVSLMDHKFVIITKSVFIAQIPSSRPKYSKAMGTHLHAQSKSLAAIGSVSILMILLLQGYM